MTGGMEIKSYLTERPSWLLASGKWWREQGDDGNPQQVPWEWTLATAPRKRQPLQARTKNFKTAKPRNLKSTLGPLLRETITENDSCTPTFTAVDLQMPKERHENRFIHRWNLKEMWYINGLLLRLERLPLKLWNQANDPHSMHFGASYTKRSQQRMKKVTDDVPPRQNKEEVQGK